MRKRERQLKQMEPTTTRVGIDETRNVPEDKPAPEVTINRKMTRSKGKTTGPCDGVRG
jgi:hypothetical protein